MLKSSNRFSINRYKGNSNNRKLFFYIQKYYLYVFDYEYLRSFWSSQWPEYLNGTEKIICVL
jgi:hypothetical protein